MVFDPGTNGFVRGTLRALARGRRQADLGRDIPFRLAAWRDGRVVLQDTATGQEVQLNAFGDTNKDVFLRLLTASKNRNQAGKVIVIGVQCRTHFEALSSEPLEWLSLP